MRDGARTKRAREKERDIVAQSEKLPEIAPKMSFCIRGSAIHFTPILDFIFPAAFNMSDCLKVLS